MAERLILVGRVAGAFGVRGEVRITSFTAQPEALLDYGALLREDGTPGLTLAGGRVAPGGLIVRATEVATREAAEALKGLHLFIPRSRLPPLDDDEFYLADLIGLSVVSPAGESLGLVKAISNFGAGELLEVAPADGGPTWLAPFTLAAVPDVRLAEGVVVVVRPD